jgi:tetratricopeptide (TPR) repeat protein
MVCYHGRRKNPLFTALVLSCGLVFSHPSWSQAAHRRPKVNVVQSGFAALRAHRWMRARLHFEKAIQLWNAPSQNATHTDASRSISPRQYLESYYLSMNGKQSLLEFACFSAQMEGDDEKAEQYLNQVEAMRGPMWGTSWVECVRRSHRVFFTNLRRARGARFAKTLVLAGRLLLESEDRRGLSVLRRARRIAPHDVTVNRIVASSLICRGKPREARLAARASLAQKPDQPSVLIDLATAEWMLGRLKPALTAAQAASALDPQAPGPHGILAFVALELGDAVSAKKEAEVGNRLSNEHRFYQTILAVCLCASGDDVQARNNMNAAWKNGLASEQQLREWFFRGRPLKYARQLLK